MRYQLKDGSDSNHCCFSASCMDTETNECVFESFEYEQAIKIVDVLNNQTKMIDLYLSIKNCYDGSGYPMFFLTKEKAESLIKQGEAICDGVEVIPTYEGSKIHLEAIENEKIEQF